jgi:hypothetical protein
MKISELSSFFIIELKNFKMDLRLGLKRFKMPFKMKISELSVFNNRT